MAIALTWECLGQDHCDGCGVAQYVEAHPDITDEQRLGMLSAASAEIGYQEMSVDEVVDILRQGELGQALSDEVLTVSVNGVRRWNEQSCRQVIRQQRNS